MVESKVTASNQTQVPADVRARYGVVPGDLVVWEENAAGELTVRFRKRRKLEDIIGIAPRVSGGDAVKAKKRAQRGGR